MVVNVAKSGKICLKQTNEDNEKQVKPCGRSTNYKESTSVKLISKENIINGQLGLHFTSYVVYVMFLDCSKAIKQQLTEFLILVDSYIKCGRQGGLMVSALDFESVVGALRCVPGQDILLSLCLYPPRCINGYRRIYCWG